MARTRVSTTVDGKLLTDARRALAGVPDAALIDEALAALVRQHRAVVPDAAYAAYAAYDEQPLDTPDEWGDLASFRQAAAASYAASSSSTSSSSSARQPTQATPSSSPPRESSTIQSARSAASGDGAIEAQQMHDSTNGMSAIVGMRAVGESLRLGALRRSLRWACAAIA